MVDELIEYFEHRPQLSRLNGSPFQRVMFDLGALPENGVKAIIKCLRAALSAPVAQVDVEKLREGALQAAADIHGGILNASKTLTVRAALNYVFDHLTPKTQEAEG